MTPETYRATLSRLGLTQAGAAHLLGVDVRTSRKWALGERPIPEPVQRLLWGMERDPTLPPALAEWADREAA